MQRTLTTSYSVQLRIVLGVLLVFGIILAAAIITINETKVMVYNAISHFTEDTEEVVTPPTPFPVSVEPATKSIIANESVNQYLLSSLADVSDTPIRTSWWHNLTRRLVQMPWYQNLASPTTRILVIWPGDRKEQIVDNFGDILRWDAAERAAFLTQMTMTADSIPEGVFLPGHYVVSVGATPQDVSELVQQRFIDVVLSRYDDSVDRTVPLQQALTIASLLEREAYSFEDMREISGVIWNRLFINMPLQLDATLQYAKANDPSTAAWWPVPRPEDKYIDSPFNTYQNTGLPPAPIANPSPAAILAALNPNQTDCLFYFHHDDGVLYCSEDYEGHTEKLRGLYGQGR